LSRQNNKPACNSEKEGDTISKKQRITVTELFNFLVRYENTYNNKARIRKRQRGSRNLTPQEHDFYTKQVINGIQKFLGEASLINIDESVGVFNNIEFTYHSQCEGLIFYKPFIE
jgi:hypothetical protein